MKKRPTCFLDLPGELRNRIYRLSLVHKRPIQLALLYPRRTTQFKMVSLTERFSFGDSDLITSEWASSADLMINTLRTCRQVHQEAAQIFYGENVFSMPEHGTQGWIRAFQGEIGATSTRCVRRVRIGGFAASQKLEQGVEGVVAFGRLERVEIVIEGEEGLKVKGRGVEWVVKALAPLLPMIESAGGGDRESVWNAIQLLPERKTMMHEEEFEKVRDAAAKLKGKVVKWHTRRGSGTSIRVE